MRQEIAALETGYRIGRLLVLREVLGQAPAGFSAATKTFCTEFEQRVAAFCARVVGPDAMLVRAAVARNICYAPAYTIMGGTTNILRNILGERVLGLPREPSAASSAPTLASLQCRSTSGVACGGWPGCWAGGRSGVGSWCRPVTETVLGSPMTRRRWAGRSLPGSLPG